MYVFKDFDDVGIRLLKITIENLKNTEHGIIEMPIQSEGSDRKASVLGLYGANGSGKTAVIVALNVLKCAMSGNPLPSESYYYISMLKNEAILKFEFSLDHDDLSAIVTYQFSLIKDEEYRKASIENERVTYKLEGDKSLLTIIDTNKNHDNILFLPKYKYEEIIKHSKDKMIDLMVSNKLSKEKKESFIFRKQTLDILSDGWGKEVEVRIMHALHYYAKVNLFVVFNEAHLFIDGNKHFPLHYRFKEAKTASIESGEFGIQYGINDASEEQFNVLNKIIMVLSEIITEIVPGLKLALEHYGKIIRKNGEPGIRFELISEKNGVKMPIKYESDGIKKIISILCSLVAMFNKKGILVAVDELDSGIFEYLLGELLVLINDNGLGQLIFTSHNLHPLELLGADNICFTTVNEKNRYIKFSNVKATNNLRNLYLREIGLRSTGQKEIVFDNVKSYRISRSFKKAGKLYGSFEG